ncbi:hypothetical protein [Ruania alba]|uniref:DUF2993 domain-containing protein n=1 Tax=Ruania alba TaxID=648782 RepID=A0A1H5G6E8_9MICO|nr:hypothetical protein [Ruania alba]SEE10974.1 hypothetical protein SAMN04488554_1547 [Ruania alba]
MFPLGPGDIPTTGAELETRLTHGLHALLRPTAGEARVRAQAWAPSDDVAPQGSRIARLDVDITDVHLRMQDKVELPAPVGSGTPAEVDHLAVRGAPVRVQDLPVTTTAEVRDLPVRYQPRSDGQYWIEVDERVGHQTAGRVQVTATITDIEQAVAAEAGARLSSTGFALADLRLQVAAAGPREASIQVDATLRRGLLRAGVSGSATARVGADMVVTLSDLEVSSSSPLVGMALTAVRGRLAQWEGHQVDLRSLTFGGLAVSDVELTVTRDVVGVRAELGTAPEND